MSKGSGRNHLLPCRPSGLDRVDAFDGAALGSVCLEDLEARGTDDWLLAAGEVLPRQADGEPFREPLECVDQSTPGPNAWFISAIARSGSGMVRSDRPLHSKVSGNDVGS
jgi:hypothetical protein